MMAHATIMFDVDKHGVDGLAKALRNLPVGGSIKLASSGLALRRVHGGRAYQLECPPRVKRPELAIPVEALKSAQTAAPALEEAHKKVVASDG